MVYFKKYLYETGGGGGGGGGSLTIDISFAVRKQALYYQNAILAYIGQICSVLRDFFLWNTL